MVPLDGEFRDLCTGRGGVIIRTSVRPGDRKKSFLQPLSHKRQVGSRRGWYRWTGNTVICVLDVASASEPPFDREIKKTRCGGVVTSRVWVETAQLSPPELQIVMHNS